MAGGRKIVSGLEEMKKVLYDAYGILARRFDTLIIPSEKFSGKPQPEETRPGVYVFWTPLKGVIKVGRSFDNSRKRALSHLPANTGGMVEIIQDQKAILYLFNPNDSKDLHLVAGLEVLFEIELDPLVLSKRLG